MERPETNRLIEDKKFHDYILGLILEQLEDLSRIYDQGNAESGVHGRTWAKIIDKIRAGEKLGAEDEVKKIVLEVGQKRLSSTELHYLFSLIFKPPRQKINEDED